MKSDSSKTAWKYQEGLVYLALIECADISIIRWNFNKSKGRKKDFTPQGMSIDPDIVIGKDYNHPDALVFVTHATSQHASEKKFWRTVPEAIEEKSLESHPRLLSVLYAGMVKASIKEAYEYLFDGTYHLDESDKGVELSNILMAMASVDKSEDPLTCLQKLKVTIIDQHRDLWEEFCNKISSLFVSPFGPKHEALISITKSKQSRFPSARKTSLRQSICKLLTLPEMTRDAILAKKDIVDNAPFHSVLFGWFEPLTYGGKYRLKDYELKYFISSESKSVIDYELSRAKKLNTLEKNIETLALISNRREINRWIIDHYNELIDADKMYYYMKEVFTDVNILIKDYIKDDNCSQTHWLFETMMSMLRTETGRADGYGYSSLAEDVGDPEGITGGYIYIADFKNRKEGIPFKENIISNISRVFSLHLARLGKQRVAILLNDSVKTLATSIYKYQISSYSLFNPIEWLVIKQLERHNIPYKYPAAHDSFLSEYLDGATTQTKNIINVMEGKIWIKCQSGYDGKTDKRKELCGRVGAMKLCYSSKELEKIRFFLVIDGYFTNEDIKLFDKAGWDGVFYYDEIDKLMKII